MIKQKRYDKKYRETHKEQIKLSRKLHYKKISSSPQHKESIRKYQEYNRGNDIRRRRLYEPDDDELIITQRHNGNYVTQKEIADILGRTLKGIMGRRYVLRCRYDI